MHWATQATKQISEMRINHRNWTQTLNEAFTTLSMAEPGDIVSITGPSRAGKSRMIKELNAMLSPPVDLLEPGTLPVISVLASNCSVNGSFSTKNFTLRALKALEQPFLSTGQYGADWDIQVLQKLNRATEATLRLALEEALRIRKTLYFFIDESQHFAFARGGLKEASAILDSLKCLAQETGVIIVLAGAYPILKVLAKCPHLLARETPIHLQRYRPVMEDLLEFGSILLAYSEKLLLPVKIPSLRHWEELIHGESFGCIGNCGKWTKRALIRLAMSGEEELQLKHFEQTRRPKKVLEIIAKEIYEGEQYLNEHFDLPLDDSASSDEEWIDNATIIAETAKRKTKPFQKSPRNYDIGGRL